MRLSKSRSSFHFGVSMGPHDLLIGLIILALTVWAIYSLGRWAVRRYL